MCISNDYIRAKLYNLLFNLRRTGETFASAIYWVILKYMEVPLSNNNRLSHRTTSSDIYIGQIQRQVTS